MKSFNPLRSKILVSAFLLALCLWLFASAQPSLSHPVEANDISILCIAEIIESAGGVMDDPCDDSDFNMNQVTAIRSTADLPADLSPFDIITFSSSANVIYNSVANEINEYVANGGGLMFAFPVVESGTNPLPTGFEFTMTSLLWPEFPEDPGPVEFTAAGLAHPIADGVTTDDLVGAIITIPIGSLGPRWDLLVKPVNHPNVGIAVGEHGTGRILLLNIGIDEETTSGLKFATQILDWLAGESSQPPPSGPDMQIDAIEVTQAVQDLDNSVKLIAGKRAFVRVHVSAPETVDGVIAELTGALNGNALPQTLKPVNEEGSISVIPDPDRGQLDDSFLFELPIEWTQEGKLTLKAKLDPDGLKSDPELANNVDEVEVEFVPAAPLRLKLFNVRFPFRGEIYIADEVHLDLIESWLKKAYPISTLDIQRITANYPFGTYPNVNRSIEALAALKRFESIFLDVPADTYYYAAVIDPEFFIQGSAATDYGVAIGPVGDPKSASGQGWDTDATYGDWIAGHEVGHLIGRKHVACPGTNPDNTAAYPHKDGKISPTTMGDSAIYGFDLDTWAIYGPEWVDMMSYCFPKWISDFTYEGIHEDMSGGGLRSADVAEVSADKFFIISAYANLEAATVDSLDIQQVEHTATLPLPSPGDWTIALLNAAGSDLATYPFSPSEIDSQSSDGTQGIISEIIPWQAGVATIEVRKSGSVLATKTASVHPPVVTITSPPAGQTFDQGEIDFSWAGSDEDGDLLTYTVLHSHNGTSTWNVLVTDLITPTLSLNSDMLPGGADSHLRIIASDGFNSSETTVGPFTTPSAEPKPSIITPSNNNNVFQSGQLITLEATVHDLEDGQLTGNSLSWQSDLDGQLGLGELIQSDTLSVGTHRILLTATDSDGQIGSTTRTVTVLDENGSMPNTLSIAPYSVNVVMAIDETHPARSQLTVRSSNRTNVNWTARTDAAWLSVDQVMGTTPSSLNMTVDSSGLAAGSYSGTIIFESEQVDATTVEVPVFLEVSETALPTLIWHIHFPSLSK